jgi:hypothetical protein
MKFVMSSATEAELCALYTTAKEMVPLHQTLIKMGWPQPCTPIQMDNSTAIGVTKLTIVLHKTKSMNLRLWWLRFQNLNNSSASTGIRAVTIEQTTTPSTTYQSTTKPTDPFMPVQQPNYLELMPLSCPVTFFS